MSRPSHTSSKSVKMTALCRWFERNPKTFAWEATDNEVVACPALVGWRFVTIQLPSGSNIRRQHGFADKSPEGGPLVVPPEATLGYTFGRLYFGSKVSSEMIEFRLVPVADGA
ncbi:hypothetical protein [Pseudomonas sp. EMN2]|uniref:hypothetical protein n=1 Tax=Pseudomonas sp. EMN2 TaxID=2615212 RepID=UPI00129BC411|nr:hypothetical protein [Pseudomonas sp. EMN2]